MIPCSVWWPPLRRDLKTLCLIGTRTKRVCQRGAQSAQLAGFLVCFFFGDALRRDSAPRNLNRGRKRKRWGRGRGEKAVRKIAGGFSHCLLPSLSPPCRFLFPPRFSFCAAVTLTFRTTKEKTHWKTFSYASYAVREWVKEGQKAREYRDCRASLENSIFTPSFSSPAIPDLHLCLAFASLVDFCTLLRLERENRKAVNCQLLLWHLPGELLTGNRTYLSFALQVLFAKGPNFI